MINPTPANGENAGAEAKTILIVEDEVLVRFAMADSLREAGYLVIEAANADEALALLDGVAPVSLVFTDIQMPGTMDGLGLALFIRDAYPKLPIILTSGAVRPPATGEPLTFFGKPYDPEAVVRRVKALLDEDQ